MVCMYLLAMAVSASTNEQKSALFDTLNLINEYKGVTQLTQTHDDYM